MKIRRYGMNSNIDEVILRSCRNREPMPFERLKFLCYFAAGMVAEVLGFVVVILFIIRVS